MNTNYSNSLMESWEIQSDASSVGFDWPDISGVFDKVAEELCEIRSAWDSGAHEHAKRELGDLLFATVNLARFLNADPGDELHRANGRFRKRFARLKEELAREGHAPSECTLEEMDVVWERVKRVIREEEAGGRRLEAGG